MARINGIQRASSYGNNPYVEELEKSLHKELSEVLNQEEMLWFQKSRLGLRMEIATLDITTLKRLLEEGETKYRC